MEKLRWTFTHSGEQLWMQSRILEVRVKVRSPGVARDDPVLTNALDSAWKSETTDGWCRGEGAHGDLGSISRAASDKHDCPIAPRAHARKDGVSDIYGSNKVRVHVVHHSFGAENRKVDVSLRTRRGLSLDTHPSSSLAPYVSLPALLTRTSMRPHMARASFMHLFISPIGEVTSSVRHLNLVPSILGSRRSRSKDFKDRAVAMA